MENNGTVKFCPNCGTQNTGTRFCVNCGSQLDVNQQMIDNNMNNNMMNNNMMPNMNDGMNNNYNNNMMPNMNGDMNNNMMNNYNQNVYQQPPQYGNYQPVPKKSNKGLLFGLIGGGVAVVVIILLVVFVFMGGGNTIKCTATKTESGVSMDTDVKLKFDGGKFSSGTLTETVDVSSLSSSQKEKIKESDLCRIVPTFADPLEFSNCKQKTSGDIMSITVDIGTVLDEEISKEKTIKEFEEMGFTCK